MKIINKCKICNKEFESYDCEKRKYCSFKCTIKGQKKDHERIRKNLIKKYKKLLKKEYIINRKTIMEISKELKIKKHKLTDLMKVCGIKFRSNSESHQGIQEGKNNPAYKDGSTFKKHYCVECHEEISYCSWKKGTQRCSKCWHKFCQGENHPNWKGGKPYCIDCGKELSSYSTTEGRCNECYRIHNVGKNHHSFIHGQGYFPYPNEFNDQLRDKIRERDNYTCQNCSMTEEEHLIVRGINLHVHHIDYNKENCKEDNLITLCNNCNLRANSNRNYWQDFYKSKMEVISCSQKKN